MKLKHTSYFFCFLSFYSVATASGAVKVTPVANVNLLGGQYWISESMPVSFGGNVDVFFSPVINFSPKSALLPIYTGVYSGTKDVRELVGGGTLTRELQDHSMALKFVNKLPSDWKLKTRIGYKIEYLKETKDETFGKGLFDFQKFIFGFEGERTLKTLNYRLGIDYYTMHYPNYQSLVSQDEFATSIDTTTYSEISSQAGKDVLDYSAVSAFFTATQKLSSKVFGTVHYDVSLKNFKDQKIVKNTGEFSSTLRQDMVHYLTFGVNLGTKRVSLGLSDIIQYYDSNQNSYDVGNSKYISNYYDFIENGVMPNISFYLGSIERPSKLSLFWELSYRAYLERPAQYADGSYKDDKTSQVINTMGFSFTYPVAGSLSAKFAANYRDSSSNMRYEKNYKYNYYTLNYFAGVAWEY